MTLRNPRASQLTDAQKVLIARQIEPDVEAVAEANRLANLKQGDVIPMGTNDPLGRTRDVVAAKVGFGSGRTYERAKQVIERSNGKQGQRNLVHLSVALVRNFLNTRC